MLNKPYRTLEDGLQIFGNNHRVPLVCGFELSERERRDYDYLSDDELESELFFRYKGSVYGLCDFMRIEGFPELARIADGIHNDTYFSGILVKYTDDNDFIKVYTFYS